MQELHAHFSPSVDEAVQSQSDDRVSDELSWRPAYDERPFLKDSRHQEQTGIILNRSGVLLKIRPPRLNG